MSTMSLSEADRILGCILGKAIGGTLGTPVEGRMELLHLSYYDPVPKGILPNDDFDIQLLFLEAVEGAGGRVDTLLLARAWSERMHFPFDEYGVATHNLARGLLPPVSGSFDNPFKNCMGCPIRSELWALLAPGKPWRAAYFAMQDAMIDHGAESIAAEMFFAALEARAFGGEPDFRVLIRDALGCINPLTETAQAVRFCLEHCDTLAWPQLREAVLARFGHPNFTEAPQNIAFTIFGLLYFPNDFEQALLCTTNCGYDTDCTAATLGAIWGLVKGPAFPARWLTPIGGEMLASHAVCDMAMPKPVAELTRHILHVKALTEAHYATFTEATAESAIQTQLQDLSSFRLAPDSDLRMSGGCVVHRGTDTLTLKTSEPVTAVAIRTPFRARVTPAGISVSAPDTGVLPNGARLTITGQDGRLHQVGLVTPHEFWLADGEAGDPLWRQALWHELDAAFRPAELDERTFALSSLSPKPWLLLRAFFHLPQHNHYRIGVFAECPTRAWLDGNKIIDRSAGAPCIPAPHRHRDGHWVRDLMLQGGWHRWDMLFHAGDQIRNGLACFTIAHAHTKQLVDIRLRRSTDGVYAY